MAAWNRDADGEGQVVIDNRPAIAEMLAAHNAKIPSPDSGCGCALRARPRRLPLLAATVASAIMLVVRRRRRRR